jgi:hypothetical protein
VTALVRRYLKTAIGFLVAGLLLGAWILVQRELGGAFSSSYLVSAHTHAILVGFVMLMILGVALWMFPRPEKSDLRYKPGLANAAYWLVTLGTGGRLVGELLRTMSSDYWLRWVIVVSGFAQISGLVLYFHTMWSRIRAVGSGVREAKGERF